MLKPACAKFIRAVHREQFLEIYAWSGPFGRRQESRPRGKSNSGSPRFKDFPSLCACSE